MDFVPIYYHFQENKEQKSIAENCECPQTAEQTSDTTDDNAKEQEKILSDTQKLVEAMSGTKNAGETQNYNYRATHLMLNIILPIYGFMIYCY